MPEDVVRLHGGMILFEQDGQRQRLATKLTRAILRPNGMILEFEIDDDPYEVSMFRVQEWLLQGTWTRLGRHAEKGSADCTLHPQQNKAGDRYFFLEGTWEEKVTWEWLGKLTPGAELVE
jgi:hypothetical protein